jgi:hypothetical protein
MGLPTSALLADACLDPIIDFRRATGCEIAVWGVCLSLSMICAGLAFRWTRGRNRGLLLLAAFGFFVGCFAVALREQSRTIEEHNAKAREDRKKATESPPLNSSADSERDDGKHDDK